MKKFCFWGLIFFVSIIIPDRFTHAVVAKSLVSPYLFNFNSSGHLAETGDTSQSTSPYWWLNSGGYMNINSGNGSTVMGSLPSIDPWRLLYSNNNPTDTDNGYHPQNIFRLVSRSKWMDMRQEAYFIIDKDNMSSSSNRNSSNGLLLFNRYQNGDNLYYTGVRVDGTAIIKKKKNGTYYTMSQVPNVYPGTYNRTSSPNLLPKNKWIGLRSEVINLANGAVEIKLYIDKGWQGTWQLIAHAIDTGYNYGGSAFQSNGYVGIRTDFMDVKFENFRVKNIDTFSS